MCICMRILIIMYTYLYTCTNILYIPLYILYPYIQMADLPPRRHRQ